MQKFPGVWQLPDPEHEEDAGTRLVPLCEHVSIWAKECNGCSYVFWMDIAFHCRICYETFAVTVAVDM